MADRLIEASRSDWPRRWTARQDALSSGVDLRAAATGTV
jgi:hypothetical protein